MSAIEESRGRPASAAPLKEPEWDCRLGIRTTHMGFGRAYDYPYCFRHMRNVSAAEWDADHCAQGKQVTL